MDNSLLASTPVRFGDSSISLFANKSRQPATFCVDTVKTSYYLFAPSKVSIEDKNARIMICFIITYDNRLPLQIVPLAHVYGIVSGPFVVILELCKA